MIGIPTGRMEAAEITGSSRPSCTPAPSATGVLSFIGITRGDELHMNGGWVA